MKCVEEDYLQWIFLQLCLQWHLGCDLLQNFSLCLSLSAFFLLTTAILEQLLISKASSLYQADRELLAWYRGGVWRGSSEINCWALVHMEYLQLSTETVYIQTSFVPGNIFSPPPVDFCLTRNSQQASANLSIMLVPWEKKERKNTAISMTPVWRQIFPSHSPPFPPSPFFTWEPQENFTLRYWSHHSWSRQSQSEEGGDGGGDNVFLVISMNYGDVKLIIYWRRETGDSM